MSAEWWRNLWRAQDNARELQWSLEGHRQTRRALDALIDEEQKRLGRMVDGSACGHPRQITGEGIVLPCAWPQCQRGSRSPFLRIPRRADTRLWWPPEATPDEVAWPPDLEFSRESGTAHDAIPRVQWFWVLRSDR